MPRHLISNRYVPVRWHEVLVGIFYRQMSRRTKERGCTRKMAEHNIVTQNRPVTCGSKNLKREN